MVRFRLLTFAVGFMLLVGAARATAATITVNTTYDDQLQGDGQCSLRKAIDDVDSPGSTQSDCAPAAFGANTIVLPSLGYFGSAIYVLNAGTLDISSTVSNLTIEGIGESSTTIDAEHIAAAFDIASGARVTIQDLTIADGQAPAGANGGGILNQGALTLFDAGLSGNRAGDGAAGAAGNPGGGAGSPGGSGGGIFNTGTLTLDGVTFGDNAAGAGGPGGGGGQGNNGGAGGTGGAGGAGGGVMNAGGSLTVENSTFRSNDAGKGGQGGGGGMANVTDGGGGAAGGPGGTGGGIESDGGSISVINSTFASNSAGSGGAGGNGGPAPSTGEVGGMGGAGGAGGSGGSVRTDATTPVTLLQTTTAGNNAGAGGAAGSGGSGGTPGASGNAGSAGSGGGPSAQAATITLQNSLLALNSGGNCGSGVLDGGHNLSSGDSTCPPTFSSGDPNLGPLQDNGGPAPTISLQPGSAAIDQIPATGAGCTPTDERGVRRPSGPRCDIGAYEVAPPTASTLPASQVTRTSAVLNGSVVPNAGIATVIFQYGRTRKYGSSSPTGPRRLAAVGVTAEQVTWRAGKLKPNTTYHYRVVVEAMDGTSYGADRTFTTTVAVIKHLKISPSTFSVSATATYTDSKAATTTLSALRCVPRRGRCAKYLYVAKFIHHDRAGRNRLTLSTRIGGKRLGPGEYRLEATPKFRGNFGTTAGTTFRVT